MVALTIYGEAILLVIHIISIFLLDENISEDTITIIGWIIIVLVGKYILINWGIVLTFTIKGLLVKFKERKITKLQGKEREKKDEEYKRWKKRN